MFGALTDLSSGVTSGMGHAMVAGARGREIAGVIADGAGWVFGMRATPSHSRVSFGLFLVSSAQCRMAMASVPHHRELGDVSGASAVARGGH